MRLAYALRILREHREEIAAFGVTGLSIFGSVARDEAGPESDVDILVEFKESVGLFHLIRLQTYLEELLNRKVDLTTIGGLKERMREQVLKEAIRAAWSLAAACRGYFGVNLSNPTVHRRADA